MTERTFRILLGIGLFGILYFNSISHNQDLLGYFIVWLLFEGITNWRLTRLLSAVRKPINDQSCAEFEAVITVNPITKIIIPNEISIDSAKKTAIDFEAEQAMRLMLALLLLITFYLPSEILWIIPWFIASMLVLGGITNICPAVMFFRRLGFS
jgi:hypothetical protein